MSFPDDYTTTPQQPMNERSRNTMLGNTWHLPILPFQSFSYSSPLLKVQLSNLAYATPTSRRWCASGTTPQSLGAHHPKLQNTTTCHRWTGPDTYTGQDYTISTASHHWTQLSIGPSVDKQTSPTLTQSGATPQMSLNTSSQTGKSSNNWFHTLPKHCQQAYKQPSVITQIPVLHHLLQNIQYPHADILFKELAEGFPLIGQLQPGLNWKVRTDSKYTEHQTLAELHTKKLHQNRLDDHWLMMADEIAKERKMGRMDGPFYAPEWWDVPAVALNKHPHTRELKPIPHPTPVIAVAFGIQQTGSDGQAKIRRGEDWRRSGHNRSCNMDDQPHTRSLCLVCTAHSVPTASATTCVGTRS